MKFLRSGVRNTGLIFLGHWNDDWNTEYFLPTNTWVHLSGTYDGTTEKFYVNGSFKNSRTPQQDWTIQSDELIIGATFTTQSGNYFNGQIDEMRIWYEARTESEIQTNMYNEIYDISGASNLATYYQFNATDGAVLTDLKGYNTGTLVSMDNSDWTESYAMVVPIPMEALGISQDGFTANWYAPEIGIVENYILDISEITDFSTFVSGYEGLNVGNVTSQDITGLTSGATYYYRVRAEKSSVSGTGGFYRDYISTITLYTEFPIINTQPESQIDTCEGTKNILLYVNGDYIETFQWQISTDGTTWTDLSDNNDYANTGTATMQIIDATIDMQNTIYRCKVCNQDVNCIYSDELLLTIIKTPIVDLDTEIEIIEGESVTLSAGTFNENVTYFWYPTEETTNSIIVSEENVYSLTVSEGNCYAYDSIRVFFAEQQIVIPNAFTPNGDGINDTWKIFDPSNRNYDVIILDKNGSTLISYTTHEIPEGWDGRKNNIDLPSDIYWYVLKYEDGEVKTGTILLKR